MPSSSIKIQRKSDPPAWEDLAGKGVGIAVGTFGEDYWADLARARALPSANNQTEPADDIIHVHADTLHEARNQACAALRTDWVIFLDADDELDPGYVAAMKRGTTDLRQPATLGVYPDGSCDPAPAVIPAKRLIDANYLVIGTMAPRDLVLQVGGFEDLPAMEDWSLWLRCYLEGATIGAVPDAVYRVSVNPTGRNACGPRVAGRVYHSVRSRHEARFRVEEARRA